MEDKTVLQILFGLSVGFAGFLFGAFGLADPILGFAIGGTLHLGAVFGLGRAL